MPGLYTQTAGAVRPFVLGLRPGALPPRSTFLVPELRSDPLHEQKLDADEVINISEGRGGLCLRVTIQKRARPQIFAQFTRCQNVFFLTSLRVEGSNVDSEPLVVTPNRQ